MYVLMYVFCARFPSRVLLSFFLSSRRDKPHNAVVMTHISVYYGSRHIDLLENMFCHIDYFLLKNMFCVRLQMSRSHMEKIRIPQSGEANMSIRPNTDLVIPAGDSRISFLQFS
jgi:hypothetical protein